MDIMYKTYELNTDIEHFAKPINISGATTIRLTYLPSGVQCWISSESNGTNLYPLVNRGDGWVDLPEPLYNLYIYTKGTNVDNEKIVLNYTGQRDFFQYGNSSTERIDKVGNLESVSNNVLYDLFKVRNDMFSTRNLVYMDFVNASWGSNLSSGSYLKFVELADLSNIKFTDGAIYRIVLEGHCDISSLNNTFDVSNAWVLFVTQSLHFDLIDKTSLNVETNFIREADTPQYSNLYTAKSGDIVFETKTNHFTLLGIKQVYNKSDSGHGDKTWAVSMNSPDGSNFKCSYYAPSLFFSTLKSLVCSWKCRISNTSGNGDFGFHFGVKVQIEEMESLPNDPIINTKPYINPRFLKQG